MKKSTKTLITELKEKINENQISEPKEILKLGIKLRLEKIIPFLLNDTWKEAMGISILEKDNLQDSIYELCILVDELCYQSKQYDTDFQWYVKRAGLAGIYGSTEIFMLTDKSENFQDTWNFLDNLVDQSINFKNCLDNIFN
jgi:ubiquinone biosynthesis protein COQ9